MPNALFEVFKFPFAHKLSDARRSLNLTCARRKASNAAVGCNLARHSESREPEWSLTLHKREGDLMGVGLGNASTGAVIFNIPEGGLVDQWNEANQQRLYPGQVITEVNGVRGYWSILEELRRPGVLALTISNSPPPNAKPSWFEDIAATGKSLQKKGGIQLRLEQEGSNATSFSSLPTVKAGDCGVDQCAICIDDVGPGETLVQLPCKHAYHPMCAARWLSESGTHARGKRQCCPLCCQKVTCAPDGRAVTARGEELRG
jgi:hypothetical protein